MTTEVAILTRSCVALAADSALTIGEERVYKSANKLFALSKDQPIAVMIFGSADYVSVPWETVIKSFRATASHDWGTITDAASELFEYLQEDKFSDWWDDGAFAAAFGENFADVALAQLRGLNVALDTPEAVRSTIEFSRRVRSQADRLDDMWSVDRYLAAKAIVQNGVNACVDEYCRDYGITASDNLRKALTVGAANLLFRAHASQFMTGVVVAGFGSEQLFPELVEFHVDGTIDGELRAWTKRAKDLNEPSSGSCVVIPFAVSNEVFLFMERIDGSYIPFLAQLMGRMLEDYATEIVDAIVPDPANRPAAVTTAVGLIGDKIVTALEAFGNVRSEYASQPIIEVLRSLPKEELAAVAEALVELTSLQRRVVGELETVGGPVDVAVISKGDGLVWIKRKHYFDMAKNYDYLLRQLAARLGGDDG